MILEIRTIVLVKTKRSRHNTKKIITYRCDNCDQKFEGKYQKSYLTNRKFHFCCKQCVKESRKKGGIACEFQLASRDMIKWQKSVQKTMLERYGVVNISQNDDIKRKKEETTLKNFGVKNPFMLREKIMKTCIERYGKSNPMQVEAVKEKSKQTCIKRYGVENFSQTYEFAQMQISNKRHDSGYEFAKGKKFWCKSSYEKKFVKWCDTNSDISDINANFAIKYVDTEGKNRLYFVDFEIIFMSGVKQLVEIKPKLMMNYGLNPIKFEFAKRFASENGYEFKVVTEDFLKEIV